MTRPIVLALMLALAGPGCAYDSHLGGLDAGPLAATDGGAADNSQVDFGPAPLPVICGGDVCARGEVCCLLDLHCHAVGDPACAPPPGSPAGACASNADCPIEQSCQVVGPGGGAVRGRCGGLGTCWTIDFGCGGVGPGVCGCDGRDYADECDAASHRVRLVAGVPCGQALYYDQQLSCGLGGGTCVHGECDATSMICVDDDPLVVCGNDAQCPAGDACCLRNGLCIGPADAVLCTDPPAGTAIACNTDMDCERFDGTWWSTLPSMLFCDGPTCDGPGGCRAPPSCDGTVAEVCGCDARTYQNACEAARSHVRVAHEGPC